MSSDHSLMRATCPPIVTAGRSRTPRGHARPATLDHSGASQPEPPERVRSSIGWPARLDAHGRWEIQNSGCPGLNACCTRRLGDVPLVYSPRDSGDRDTARPYACSSSPDPAMNQLAVLRLLEVACSPIAVRQCTCHRQLKVDSTRFAGFGSMSDGLDHGIAGLVERLPAAQRCRLHLVIGPGVR